MKTKVLELNEVELEVIKICIQEFIRIMGFNNSMSYNEKLKINKFLCDISDKLCISDV